LRFGAFAPGLTVQALLDRSPPRRLALAVHGLLPDLALGCVLVVDATA
jgi:hypothetical protein